MNARSTQVPSPTAIELTQLVVSGGRALNRRIHLIDTADGAADIVPVLNGIITAAQELLGVAEHVTGDEEPEEPEELAEFTGEWAEITKDRDYAVGDRPSGGPSQT